VFSDHWLRGVAVAVVVILALVVGFVVVAKLLMSNGGRPGVGPTFSSFSTARSSTHAYDQGSVLEVRLSSVTAISP